MGNHCRLVPEQQRCRAIQLNEDLCNIELENLTITHKLKVISDLLEDIGKSMDETTLVMHTINGLNDKYESIEGMIRHQ